MSEPKTLGEAAEKFGTPEAFMAICDLAVAANAVPLKEKLWVYEIPAEKLEIRVNGFSETRDGIDPFRAHVYWNGWPFAVLDPAGGSFCGSPTGESAMDENKFIEAVRTEIKRLG